jgi:hypothetical protein
MLCTAQTCRASRWMPSEDRRPSCKAAAREDWHVIAFDRPLGEGTQTDQLDAHEMWVQVERYAVRFERLPA